MFEIERQIQSNHWLPCQRTADLESVHYLRVIHQWVNQTYTRHKIRKKVTGVINQTLTRLKKSDVLSARPWQDMKKVSSVYYICRQPLFWVGLSNTRPQNMWKSSAYESRSTALSWARLSVMKMRKKNQNTVLVTQYHEIGTVAQLAATSCIAAPKRNQAWFFDIPWKEQCSDFMHNPSGRFFFLPG